MKTQRGSIYLVTLITVAAIVSLIFIGIALRSTSSTRSILIQDMTKQGNGVLDAREYAIQKIYADANWNTNAQKGNVFAPFTLGSMSLSSSVVDSDTGITATDATTRYRITVASTQDDIYSASRFDMEVVKAVDYKAYLVSLEALCYWPLNETAKPTFAVDSISGYKGTYSNPLIAGQATNDEGGVSPEFAVLTDQISVPYGMHFYRNREGSASMWINLSGSSMIKNYSVFGMLYKSGGVPTINLSILGGGLSAFVENSGTFSYSNFAWTPSNTILPRTWYHVTVTWGSSGLYVYVDGVEVAKNASNTDGLDEAGWKWGGEQPLKIGSGYLVSPLSQPPSTFEGAVAHFAWFRNQLTASQVAELAAIKPDLPPALSIIEDSWVQVFQD